MAKLTGPLFSSVARGSIGKELTYSSRRAERTVRFQKKQKDLSTAARVVSRGHYADGVSAWNSLSDAEKQQWHDFNDGKS